MPAGVPVAVDVTALDGFNKTATGYDGTANVTISDTGTGVSYPATVTFVSGAATFNVTFVTAGPQTVTVTDPTNPTAFTATLKVNSLRWRPLILPCFCLCWCPRASQ